MSKKAVAVAAGQGGTAREKRAEIMKNNGFIERVSSIHPMFRFPIRSFGHRAASIRKKASQSRCDDENVFSL